MEKIMEAYIIGSVNLIIKGMYIAIISDKVIHKLVLRDMYDTNNFGSSSM